MTVETDGGVRGTVGAFNFIRRIGFPSTPEVLTVFLTLAALSSILALPLTGVGLGPTLLFPFLVIGTPGIVGEALNTTTFLHGDKVLTFRRLMGLELLSWLSLIVVLPLAALTGALFSNGILWIDGFFIVLIISLPIRVLTIVSISSRHPWRKYSASLMPPTLALVVMSFDPILAGQAVTRGTIAFTLGIVLTVTGVSMITRDVEYSGTAEVRDSPMTLFRVFLQHWLQSDPGPLEDRLSAIGTHREIEGSILSFKGRNGPIGCFVLSNSHPGPYRDLGSAGLPSRLKSAVEKSVGGVTQVPHGISNHQLNIVSQKDVQQLIDRIIENYPVKTSIQSSSPMMRSNVGEAKASGQIFGNVALLTLTLSPSAMEDLPASVALEIEREAETRGLIPIIADAHNSLSNQTSITPEQARKLVEASVKVLDQLVLAGRAPFRAGSAEDPLEDFELSDGIGPGGLSALIVQTGSQFVAYLTIDGNNMNTGLRESMLQELGKIGISDGEIMTTDTHLVTGLVRSPLGYYPIGAHLDNKVLTQRVRETVEAALGQMEESTVGFSKFSAEVRVLGSETFRTVTNFVGRIGRRIAGRFYLLEALALVVALVVLFFP